MNKDEMLLESILLNLYKKDNDGETIPDEYKNLESNERIKVLSKSLENKVPLRTTLGLDDKDK